MSPKCDAAAGKTNVILGGIARIVQSPEKSSDNL